MRRVAVLMLLTLVAACSGPRASATASEAASGRPDAASVAPSASVPEGALDRVAVVERDQVRVTLELERNPFPWPIPTWATVTVDNLGPDDVVYGVDGCGLHADVRVRFAGEWIGGRQHLGAAGAFKATALSDEASGDSHLLAGFRPEAFIGRENVGCADLLQLERLAPGGSEVLRALWEPPVGRVVPGGPVVVTAMFPFLRRESDPRLQERPPIEARLDAWIIDAPPIGIVSPGVAVDIALTEPEFARFVSAFPRDRWINPVLSLSEDARTWEVGLFVDRGPPEFEGFGSVLIDAHTGQILSTRFPRD